MLMEHEKIRIPDIGKERDLVLEVNWNPKDKRTNECKVIRLHYPDGSMATVKREYLHAVLFAIGTEEQQRKLIPQTITRVKNYETTLGITASKDIMKGEKINVRVKIPLPAMEQEVISEMKTELSKKGLNWLQKN